MRMKAIALVFLCTVLLTACAAHSDSAVEDTPTWQEQYDLGLRYLEEGNYEEAILAFTAAIEIDPKQAEAYVGLADVYIEQGAYEKAQEVLENGLKLVGENQKIKDKIADLDAIIKSASFFSDDMIMPEELQVAGKPFWTVPLSEIELLYPTEVDPEYAIINSDGRRQYCQTIRVPDGLDYIGWCSVAAQQNDGDLGINKISYCANSDNRDAEIPMYIRSIQLWEPCVVVLRKLGLSEEGIICYIDQGKEQEIALRFADNRWQIDMNNMKVTDVEGNDEAVRVIQIVWTDFTCTTLNNTNELLFYLHFNENDELTNLVVHARESNF